MSYAYPVITIDGPSGTGKGTVGQILAKTLGWNLLDSGALYRVLAQAAKQHSVDITNEEALTVLAGHLDVQFKAMAMGEAPRVILEGGDVTDTIRSEECGNLASIIGSVSSVRQALLARQRAFVQEPGLVTDGRDMGTVVFPEAMLKIYLEASNDARAKRRFAQLQEKGINVSLQRVFADLEERDRRDKQRAVAPLRPAKDAYIIDTTDLTIEQVMDHILEQVRERVEVTL